VIEAAQYAAPLENKKFYPLEEFNEKYRGGITYWKFDRKEGRIRACQVLLTRTAALFTGPVRRWQTEPLKAGPSPTRSARSVM
jgi:hypothetical protein